MEQLNILPEIPGATIVLCTVLCVIEVTEPSPCLFMGFYF
jgi:hypothetical protein